MDPTLPLIPSLPSATRRWAGALSLPLTFAALIGATLADPVDDGGGSAAAQLRQAGAHLPQLRLTFLLELLAAVLFLAAVMAVAGAVRERGSAVANAGVVLGVLGGVGLTMISVGHVFLYALADSGTSGAAAVLAARDDAAGPVTVLFFTAPLAIVLLCVAAWRAGLVAWPLLVVAGAFLVLEFVPTPAGELPSLVVGLVAYGWVGLALLRGGRAVERAPRVTPAAVPAT